MNDAQTDLLVGESADRAQTTNVDLLRLGLMVEHRRLFGALSAGWLYPLAPDVGQVVGVGSVVRTPVQAASRHAICVRLSLDIGKLPDLEMPIFRKGEWTFGRLVDIQLSDEAVYWPGAIPAFAISSVSVSSAEERHRLIGMARAVSNVDFSDFPIDIADTDDECVHASGPPCETKDELAVPPCQDAIFGGLTMAVWAVPRIEPWMDVLKASVAADPDRLDDATATVEAPWWRFPPWQQRPEGTHTPAECLWLAAIDVFQDHCNERQLRSRDLLEHTTKCAIRFGSERFNDEIAAWQASTARILRTEATVQLEGWRKNPVGVAIQLVLTRPDPDRFKTWFKDMPNLPPGVAWSAATLCGLLNGYKGLATAFRGCALQRELLTVAALSACSPQLAKMHWPGGRLDLQWRKEGASFVLSHCSQDFARKAEHARGKWYTAKLKRNEIQQEAEKVAGELKWPCYVARIKDAQVPLSGDGELKIADGDLEAVGQVDLYFTGPTIFDIESFRQLVAIEQGEVPHPPASRADIPGLTYMPNFLDEDQERSLVEWIDRQGWSGDLQRRVQHYGWRYDYKAREVDSSMRLGTIPAELGALAQRLFEEKLVPQLPDQIIVNEYQADQSITPHIDNTKGFADGIATISLLESWEMIFHAPRSKEKVPRLLERRSVAVMRDEARYRWKHEIRKRKSEPALDGSGKRRKRQRRISLTFRKVLSPRSARSQQAKRPGARA